jgi:hypothetical protein
MSSKRIIAATAVAAAVLGTGLTLALSGPATAASGNPVPDTTWFQLKSADLSNTCLVEKGTTDAAYGQGCSSNHSDYWKRTSTGELVNEHSGKCLSVTGDDPGVYMNTCTENHAQLWNGVVVPVIAGGKLYSFVEYVNAHAHLSLGLVPSATGTGVDQIASGDTLWNAQ